MKLTPTEQFILDFVFSGNAGDTMREEGQRFIEVPVDLLYRARRLAQGIEKRKAGK